MEWHSRVGSGAGRSCAGRYLRHLLGATANAPVAAGGLALVFGNAVAEYWVDSGRGPGPGGSLHLSAADWPVSRSDLGSSGLFMRWLALPSGTPGWLLRDHSGCFDLLCSPASGLLAEQ